MFLTVNENGLINNLEAVFSNRGKVISEAIQNARRAGASKVSIEAAFSGGNPDQLIVTITDDGQGISDFAKLLTIAESGWSEDVVQKDNPFGMGFVALLFAADKVRIESYGQQVEWDCQMLLNGAEQPNPVPAETQPGTRITLIGFKSSKDRLPGVRPKQDEPNEILNLESWVHNEARASSIPVSFNGNDIPRPFAFNVHASGKDVIETEIGTIVFRDFSREFECVLQDHVVYSSAPYSNKSVGNVIYLNESFKARMPDRDRLINEKEIVPHITKAFKAAQLALLQAIRERMADDVAFLDKHFKDVLNCDVAMLNDIDYLPADAFALPSYPSQLADDSFYADKPAKGLRQRDDVPVITTSSMSDIGVIPALFAYEAKVYELLHNLDPGHWVFKKVIRMDSEDFILSGKVQHRAKIPALHNGNIDGDIIIGSFAIKHRGLGLTVPVQEGFSLDEENCPGDYNGKYTVEIDEFDSACIVIDKSAILNSLTSAGEILKTSSSYCDENDTFNETEYGDDKRDLVAFAESLISDSPEKYVAHLLRHLPSHIQEQLAKQPMLVTLDKDGRPTVEVPA